MAKAVLYLRKNRGIAEKMGKSVRQYVEDNLPIEKTRLKMKAVFEHCLDQKFQRF